MGPWVEVALNCGAGSRRRGRLTGATSLMAISPGSGEGAQPFTGPRGSSRERRAERGEEPLALVVDRSNEETHALHLPFGATERFDAVRREGTFLRGAVAREERCRAA